MQGQQTYMISNQMPGQQAQFGAMAIQMPAQKQEWSTGLCGCCDDCSSCCLTCFCPCVQYGKNYEDVNEEGCCSQGFLFCLLAHFGLSCCIHKDLRRDIRQKRGLPDGCGDCMTVCCCPLCAICQESRQLDAEAKGTH